MEVKFIDVKENKIRYFKNDKALYFSVFDIYDALKYEKPYSKILNRWINIPNNTEFLSKWEEMNNPHFRIDFANELIIRAKNRKNNWKEIAFTLEDWISQTCAKGFEIKNPVNFNVFAHLDIAIQASYSNPNKPLFHINFIKALQDLKEPEDKDSLKWHIRKITDNMDSVRNMLDSIPSENEE